MKKQSTLRLMFWSLLLAAVIGLFSLSGCASSATSTAASTQSAAAHQVTATSIGDNQYSDQQLKDILSVSLGNYKMMDTYRFTMVMDINTEFTSTTQSGKMTMSTQSIGASIVSQKLTQMSMAMTADIEGAGAQSGTQSVNYEMYQTPDWIYMLTTGTGQNEQWVKTKNTAASAEETNLDAIDKQLAPLENATKIEYLRSESVDGQDCYVLDITPDTNAMLQYLAGQDSSIEWGAMDPSEIFQQFKYVCYITQDTGYLKRLVVDMVINLNSDQMGVTATEEAGNMSMGFNIDMKLYDYNTAISITIPAAAANAQEVSANEMQNTEY